MLALKASGDANRLVDTCRRYLLHGTPHVFNGREEEFFDFRRCIADKFDVGFHEVFLVGSAKLGFSPYKEKIFDLDSDIDVVIVSNRLFDSFMDQIGYYQAELRRSRRAVSTRELDLYHQFLEYVAMGWIRPDKIPISFALSNLKDDWFTFFRSISNGKSEVGNYKVAGGIFRSYQHLETYLLDGLSEVYQGLRVKEQT
ncbi:MAG TPA: hypothetical protein PK880_08430 [Candidatus Competibacter sp.]|nr:hypothetical protein [Candidatus Competibacter sp.]